MPRRARLVPALLATALLVTACGEGSEPDESSAPPTTKSASPSASPSASATARKPAAATTIDITVKGGTVKPDGVSRKVKAGEKIRLHVVSDTSGELHVHSTPEQVVTYLAGTTEKTITLRQPGVVDVEDHHLGTIIVKLEVR